MRCWGVATRTPTDGFLSSPECNTLRQIHLTIQSSEFFPLCKLQLPTCPVRTQKLAIGIEFYKASKHSPQGALLLLPLTGLFLLGVHF